MVLPLNEPTYTIGVTAKILNVCQSTLRIWERKGLIKPRRCGKNRYYSVCDVKRLEYIKTLLQKDKINIQGVKKIINLVPCWEIKKCSPSQRNLCSVYGDPQRNKFFFP